MQCGGYAAYPCFANRSEGRVTLAACWAHARASSAKQLRARHNKQAGWLLLHIQHLYSIE